MKRIGADCVLLCANTWHMYADYVRENINVPLIHIGEETALAVHAEGIKKVALLGTKPTMEKDFIKGIMEHNGISVIVPGLEDRNFIHQSILEELMMSRFEASTKQRFLSIIAGLQQQGAEGVILGCTEIPLLIQQNDIPIRAFDTTHIHSLAAVRFAIESDSSAHFHPQ
jgi:aspartate racemase